MLARVGIKSLISWEDHGFTVIGEAENGKQAYDFYMDNHIDIIITDIKMPVLNGIELIRKIRAQNDHIKFIVLSSFNDFEYVKEALKSGASDYLIKLEVQPKELLEQLKKIALTFKSEDALEAQLNKKQHTSIKEKSFLKEKFFRDLLYGWIRTNYEYEKRLSELDIDLPCGNVICLMFYTDSMKIYERYKEEEIHVLNYAILNLLNEIVSEYKYTFAMSTKTKQFIIIQYSEEGTEEEDTIKRAHQLANTIKAAIKQYLNLSICVSISQPVLTFNQITEAYKQLHAIHKYQISVNEEIMHYQDFCKMNQNIDIGGLDIDLQKLEDALRLYDDIEVEKELVHVRQTVEESASVSVEILKGYCSTIVYLLSSRKAKNASVWMTQQLKWIDKMVGKSDFLDWMTYIQKEWTKEQRDLSENSRVVTAAQRLLQANYATDITLESVANHLNLSPSYLSNLFKKETGEKFIDYLTRIRISQSKIHLRVQDYKIYEVGQMVGYDNEYYFSRVFKKHTGLSPRQYRSKQRV